MSASGGRCMKLIAKGSSGTVFQAITPPIPGAEPMEPVAIKVMARTTDTEREATIAQLFSGSDHVVPLISCKMGLSSIELTMPWIPETVLDLVVARKGAPLSLGRAFRLFDQMLAATKMMHSRYFVHKDLKLENMLHQDGQIFLCDFGFSRPFIRGTASLCDNLGSLHYAAPELWMAMPYEGPEVDVWALGVCLYLMTTGFFPFGGADPEEIFEQIEVSSKRLRFPENTCRSSRLRDLIRRMLTFDRRERITIPEIEVHPFMFIGRRHSHRYDHSSLALSPKPSRISIPSSDSSSSSDHSSSSSSSSSSSPFSTSSPPTSTSTPYISPFKAYASIPSTPSTTSTPSTPSAGGSPEQAAAASGSSSTSTLSSPRFEKTQLHASPTDWATSSPAVATSMNRKKSGKARLVRSETDPTWNVTALLSPSPHPAAIPPAAPAPALALPVMKKKSFFQKVKARINR